MRLMIYKSIIIGFVISNTRNIINWMQEKRSQSEIIECLFKSREVEDLEEYL